MSETYAYYPDYGSVIRVSDDKVISPCQSSTDPDFVAYMAWIEAGNTPAEPGIVFDVQAAKQGIIDFVQHHMDETAKTRGYDSILSLCTYANSSVPQFKLEGQAGIDWRDGCWATGYQIMADVLQGKRSLPTAEQVLSEMPTIQW